MRTILQLLAGASSCAAFVLLARRLAPRNECRLYALGLVVAALVYVGFAARGVSPGWLILELSGAAAFTLFAFAGLKGPHWILAGGWATHSAWDVLLHKLSETTFVPGWYPVACAAFDILLAGYIAERFAKKVSR